MASNNDAMTFEDLSAVYRIERNSSTLASVRRDLYPAMASLLTSLKAEYDKQLSIDPDSIICEGVEQRRKRAVRLSKEIVELRMKKICSLALRSAMGAQNPIDNLTSEEKEYYNSIVEASRKQNNILLRMTGKVKLESPPIDLPEPVKVLPKKVEPVPEAKPVVTEEPETEEIVDEVVPEPEQMEPEISIEEPPMIEDEGETEIEEPETEEDSPTVIIRILEDLPPFAGPDRDYNLSKEDIVRMPKVMANALISRQKAELILPTP